MSTPFTSGGGRYVYILPREAWYDRSDEGAEIDVVHIEEDGGLGWSFSVRQLPVDGLQVEVRQEGWAVFAAAHEIFAALVALVETPHGRRTDVSVSEVRDVLDQFGFEDITERTDTGGPVPVAWLSGELQQVADHLERQVQAPED